MYCMLLLVSGSTPPASKVGFTLTYVSSVYRKSCGSYFFIWDRVICIEDVVIGPIIGIGVSMYDFCCQCVWRPLVVCFGCRELPCSRILT